MDAGLLFVFGALIIVIPLVGWRMQARGRRAKIRALAGTLGFELLEGMKAAERMAPAATRQAGRERHQKLPEPVRSLVERSAKSLVCLAGTTDGVEVSVFLERRGSGKSSHTYTVVRADYPKPLPLALGVSYEGTFARLGKAVFGLPDVELGDREFDRTVRVKATDAAGARAVLSRPGARDAILGLLALSKSACVTDSYAQWEAQGIRLDPAKTRSRIAAVVAVARGLGEGP